MPDLIFSGPFDNHRCPDPSFVQITFISPQLPITVEIIRIGAAFEVRSVIGCKNYDSIFFKSEILSSFDISSPT